MTVVHLENSSPFTIKGIKGYGRGGLDRAGPAIASAVEDALRPIGRVFVDELPLTPERVRRFVEMAEAQGAGA